MAGATSAHSAAVACPTWSNGGFGNFVTHGSNVSGCDLAGEFGSFDFGGATAVGTNFSGFGFLYSTLGGANFTDANLSGANLSLSSLGGANLTGADLIGANLNGVHVSGADLTGANLAGALLTNANFTGAVFTNATLTNANLDGANFSGATLAGVVSGGLTGTPKNLPPGWSVQGGQLLHNSSVPESNIVITPWVSSTTPVVDCPTWSITTGGIGNFVTHGSNVSGCDLAGEFGSFDFGGATAVSTDFAGFNFVYSTLGGANFTDANLSGTSLPSLGGVILTGADLIGANLNGDNISGADLTDANLAGALLTNANFTGAVFTNATLTNANLDGANFSGATLAGVVSGGLTGTPKNLPPGWSVQGGQLLHNSSVPESNIVITPWVSSTTPVVDCPTWNNGGFGNFVTHGSNVSGCDLAGGFGQFDFGDATAVGTNFAGIFYGYSTFAGANLTGADLIGASLPSLAGANLTRADLIGANLNTDNVSSADLTGANLAGALLTNANFTGAVFTNATLTNANLDGANFSGATLAGVVSGGLTGTPKNLPPGWSVKGGVLSYTAPKPATVSVTFTSKSSVLSAAAKRVLLALSQKLISGASVTVAGYAKGNVALARSRAVTASRYLADKIKIHVTLKTVTSASVNKVTVVTTKQ
jgi:uncharacterized protein YjbI with pentapeptide repeats